MNEKITRAEIRILQGEPRLYCLYLPEFDTYAKGIFFDSKKDARSYLKRANIKEEKKEK